MNKKKKKERKEDTSTRKKENWKRLTSLPVNEVKQYMLYLAPETGLAKVSIKVHPDKEELLVGYSMNPNHGFRDWAFSPLFSDWDTKRPILVNGERGTKERYEKSPFPKRMKRPTSTLCLFSISSCFHGIRDETEWKKKKKKKKKTTNLLTLRQVTFWHFPLPIKWSDITDIVVIGDYSTLSICFWSVFVLANFLDV